MIFGEALLLVEIPTTPGWLDNLTEAMPYLVACYCEAARIEALEAPQYRGRVEDRSDSHLLLRFTFRGVSTADEWPPDGRWERGS